VGVYVGTDVMLDQSKKDEEVGYEAKSEGDRS
jgi:hypothetical protein